MTARNPKNTYLRLLAYLRPYWRHVVMLFVCTAIFAALSGVSLTMIPPFLHILFSEQPVDTVSADEGEPSPVMLPEAIGERLEGLMDRARGYIYRGRPIDRLARFCVIFFALMLLKNIFDYLLMYITMYLEQSVLHRIRNQLYSKIHALPMSFFDSQKTGHLISRITNDVNRLKGTVVYSLTSIVKNVLLTVIAVSIIVYTSWKLSLLAVVLVPLNTILITVISRKLRKRSRRAQERMADMTSVLQETISGVRVVKAFGMEGFEKSKFDVFNGRYLRDYIKMMKFGELASPLSEILGMMASVVLLWYGGRLVIAEELDPANLMLFIVAMLWVVSPVKHLSKLNSSVQEGLASGERIFQIIDIGSGAEVSGDRKIETIERGIAYEGVSFSYENGPEVLSGIDLEIHKGEVVALVGPSGAGKSTMADLLPRFYSPSSGRITIDGIDIREIEISSLRALMGIVTQETILFNDSVFNNIAYGLSECGQERVEEAARAANAHRFITEMPFGYETVIGDRGLQLSGGQRQRLAIARALLKNPQVLILDEATSALDVESEALVQEAIERLVKGRTTLVIAHRLSTIKSADRIVVVEGGRIIQTGSHEELIGAEGTYRKLYHLQIRA